MCCTRQKVGLAPYDARMSRLRVCWVEGEAMEEGDSMGGPGEEEMDGEIRT